MSLVLLAEAALAIGGDDRTRRARNRLGPFAAFWSWSGSCTFGPIGLALYRLALALDDTDAVRRFSAAALSSSAALLAP